MPLLFSQLNLNGRDESQRISDIIANPGPLCVVREVCLFGRWEDNLQETLKLFFEFIPDIRVFL